MKFTIAQDVLKSELAFVQSVVERRNMIPVLANVLIESISEDTIRISGTDLDVTIRVGGVCYAVLLLFALLLLRMPLEKRWTVPAG